MTESEKSADSAKCILHVCTSCRPSGFPREPKSERPGFLLYQELKKSIEKSNLKKLISLREADCLSLCPRPCGVAMSAPGSWTYLFGDQNSAQTAGEILDCALIYIDAPKGHMPRDKRPASLKSAILGRVPPDFEG